MENLEEKLLPKDEENKFKIMSYNVRYNNDTLRNDIDGSVKTRSKYVINNILLYKPDSIGFQEVTVSRDPKDTTWYTLLNEGLIENYKGVGLGRDIDRRTTEANPIFFNKNKFELLEEGTKWLSPNPDIPNTQFEKPTDGCRRILTYAILKNKKNNNVYMHVNTHIDYKYLENRIKQIQVVINFISKYKDSFPILLTGDFNCGKTKIEIENCDAIAYLLKNGFFDASDEAKDCFKHWTFPSIGYHKNIYDFCLKRKLHTNGIKLDCQKCCGKECDEERGKIIDYCFRCNNKIQFEKYKVITDYKACGGISSDHYPIYIEGYFLNQIK